MEFWAHTFIMKVSKPAKTTQWFCAICNIIHQHEV